MNYHLDRCFHGRPDGTTVDLDVDTDEEAIAAAAEELSDPAYAHGPDDFWVLWDGDRMVKFFVVEV